MEINKSALVVVAVMILLVFIALMISGGKNQTSLNGYSTTVTGVRLVSAKYALDGSSEFTEEQCNKLSELAKMFNSASDFIECKSPKSIYLATPDSSEKYVLTLSDENYTSIFITDKDLKYLIDYKFSDKPSSGFNKFGGRK